VVEGLEVAGLRSNRTGGSPGVSGGAYLLIFKNMVT
jgi:hypothetical protein